MATANAHEVWFVFVWGELFVIGIPAAVVAKFAEIFQDFGVQNGRADLVHAHRPLAEIDLAAAVTAEREVFVGHADQHAASRAAEKLHGFCFWCHGRLNGANDPILFSHPQDGVGEARGLASEELETKQKTIWLYAA